MNIKQLLMLLTTVLIIAFNSHSNNKKDILEYVDPLIGSAGTGHVFVGANVPFGFVQLGPTSVPQEWPWCSGYNRSDSTVIGFAHTHLSGTGIGDLHDITFMPVVGEVKYSRGNLTDSLSGLWSYQDRKKEIAKPGYYKCHLTRYGIDAELTATTRTGLHRYGFPKTTDAAIVIDLENGGGWDEVTSSEITVLNDTTIVGYRRSSGWSYNHPVYFIAIFSKPFSSYKLIKDSQPIDTYSLQAKAVYGRFNFDTSIDSTIMVKVGTSAVSINGAMLNLAAEQNGWDFDDVVNDARNLWQEQLEKVKISSSDISVLRNFYTSLYHTMIAPSVLCDVNGDYPGSDHVVHHNKGFVNYTTLSLWDTYRAAHPLMTIIHPERVPDIINTMIHIRKENGKLPIWSLMARETNCMVGYPGVPVVADAILKGFNGFNINDAYESLIHSTNLDERGQKYHRTMGYIPCDSMNAESVAYELEYCLSDWTIAQVARKLGMTCDYQTYLKRSKQYKRLFDKSTGFIRALDSRGQFKKPFDPFIQRHQADEYCEGNAWQYVWLVPHDVQGLVECFGSKSRMIGKLDSLFVVNGDIGKEAAPDMTGFIGQYVHGNEPSHHIIYLYTILGQPWKTAERVRQVLTTLYNDTPDGLCGNEDVGQMSAWYILSSLGFYQVEPAGGRYYFGSPIIDNATIKVPNGQFKIIAHNNNNRNIYIKSIKLNGRRYSKNYIDYVDIMKGGTLEFFMSNKY
ncbi:MAG: GH92 family glycosyl hydrolase [Bacteroidales bacterium]|nr:GH92 family glycosyl hydrolase [Candidatus Sodaliphilus aphodohippi]